MTERRSLFPDRPTPAASDSRLLASANVQPPAAHGVSSQALAAERERLAAELNTRVVTRAFRVGLQIASLIDAHPALAAELYPLIDETDALIRDVRSIACDGHGRLGETGS